MTFNRRDLFLGGAAMAGGLALPAHASTGYPTRDITFISPWSAGGSLNVVLRTFIGHLEKKLGRNVNLENRTGASGTLGGGMIIRAKPDGYTIGYSGNGTLVFQPMVMKGLSWSSVDDVQPIVKLNEMPTLLAVRGDSPIKNFQDFLAAVKAKPNQIRVGVAGLRTSADLEMQQVNRSAKVQIRTVPFSGGTGESIIALLGGRIEAVASYTEGLRGHSDAGTMRIIAAFTKERYEQFPNATPVGQLGIVDTLLPSANYVIGPKGMPPEVVNKLTTVCMEIVMSDEWKAYCRRGGMVHDPLGPDGMRAELKKLKTTYENIIKFLDGGRT